MKSRDGWWRSAALCGALSGCLPELPLPLRDAALDVTEVNDLGEDATPDASGTDVRDGDVPEPRDAPDVVDVFDADAPDGDVVVVAGTPCTTGAVCSVGRCIESVGRCVVKTGDLALGGRHTCARTRETGACQGEHCWGSNEWGQLGRCTTGDAGTCVLGMSTDINCSTCANRVGPLTVIAGRAVLQLAAGESHTCAIVDDRAQHGAVYCWGYNAYGQLGDGTRTSRATPATPMDLPSRRAVQVAAGPRNTCVLFDDGAVYCWGENEYGTLGRDHPSVAVRCPGSPAAYYCDPVPQRVADLGAVSRIAIGHAVACALQSDGRVVCWGDNTSGEFGRDVTTGAGQNRFPVMLESGAALTDVVQVGVAGATACALKNDGTVWCWGSNQACFLGLGATPTTEFVRTARAVSGLAAPVTQLAMGGGHVCALQASVPAVYCWGSSTCRQAGVGTGTGDRCTPRGDAAFLGRPTQIEGLFRATREVGVGDQHTCALQDNGAVWCWGCGATYGPLGNVPAATAKAPLEVCGVCRSCP